MLNTLFPFGTPLPVTSAASVLAADRCVFETRAVCASDLYIGTTDRQPYVLLDAPVIRDGVVVYALNVAVQAQHLATVLKAHRMAAGWVVSIIDRQDRIIARPDEHERFVGTPTSERLRTYAVGAEGSVRTVNVAGVPVWSAYVRLPTWDWRIVIGVPETVLAAPLRQTVTNLAIMGVLAVVLSVVAALLYGRRLSRSIGVLSRLAGRIGQGPRLSPVRSSIREVVQVGVALTEASDTLQASIAARDRAQAELRRMNENLEARVEAEVAAREEAQSRAVHAQRMQALGELAGGIAHDFNNVLQATTGCAAMIEKRADNPGEVSRFAHLILSASARGTSVTRRLLAFAQQNDLRAEPVPLPALLAGLREILSHTLGAHIAITVAVPPGLPQVLVDKGQLETVLVNLATNARDAMKAGGTLSFAAEPVWVAEPDGPVAPGPYVRIAIADTGTGMDPATLARATEPFFTTKGRGAGNGLGLAMARGFAEQSGGALALESRPGFGTTVALWLPAHAAAAAAEPAPVGADPGAGRPHRRVLVVEDEAIVREVVASQLAEEGFDVVTATDACDALTILEHAPVDAVVTDLNMPGMSGIELIRAMRARGLLMPAIVLTGNADDGVARALDGGQAGQVAVLRKPALGRNLADRLAALAADA